jgi:hypothetical protein
LWGFGREGGKMRMGVSELGCVRKWVIVIGKREGVVVDLLEIGERLVDF